MAGEVTVTTAEKFIIDTWNPELNRAIEFKTIIFSMFTDWTKRAKGGDTFHLVDRHNLTANTKAAGTDATPETITEGEQTFGSPVHQIVAQDIEDIAEVLAHYDIRSEYTLASAYSLARARDVGGAALFDDNTTQTVGVLTAELTDDNLIRAWQYGADNSADGEGKGVVSPACWAGLLKVEKFTNQLYNGDTKGRALHQAQIGMVYQATFYQSQLTVGTAPNSSGHLWWGDHFFKVIWKQPKQDSWFNPLAKSFQLATDQIYGVYERQEADEAAAATSRARLHGVRLQSLK